MPCFGSNLSSRFRRLISLSKRARGAFYAAALNPECRRAVCITVCKFVVLFFDALFDGVVALRVILNVIPRRFVLRLHILGARGERRSFPSQPPCVTLSLQFASSFLTRENSPFDDSCFPLSLSLIFCLFPSRICASFRLFSRIFRPFSLPPLFRPCRSDA